MWSTSCGLSGRLYLKVSGTNYLHSIDRNRIEPLHSIRCYFTALATRKWLHPVLAIWPVFFCYVLCYACDCVLADKFIKVKVKDGSIWRTFLVKFLERVSNLSLGIIYASKYFHTLDSQSEACKVVNHQCMTSDDVWSVLSNCPDVQFNDRLLSDIIILSTTTCVHLGVCWSLCHWFQSHQGVYKSAANLSDTGHSPVLRIARHFEDVAFLRKLQCLHF